MIDDVDAVAEAWVAILSAIAALREAGVSVPLTLHQAALKLAYALREEAQRPPGTSLQ